MKIEEAILNRLYLCLRTAEEMKAEETPGTDSHWLTSGYVAQAKIMINQAKAAIEINENKEK